MKLKFEGLGLEMNEIRKPTFFGSNLYMLIGKHPNPKKIIFAYLIFTNNISWCGGLWKLLEDECELL